MKDQLVTVVIFEDNDQLRQSMSMFIDNTEEIAVVGSFKNALHCVEQLNELMPDVIMMDIDMPGITGIEAVKKIREAGINSKILMLTVFDDNKNVFESIKAGANGYLLKKTPPERLPEYIRDASAGGAPMTSSVASQVIKMFAHQSNPEKGDDYNLSDREKEVLNQLVNGHSYKVIAQNMFISLDTVRSHIRRVYEKLHVNSKSEAVAKAFKDKLI